VRGSVRYGLHKKIDGKKKKKIDGMLKKIDGMHLQCSNEPNRCRFLAPGHSKKPSSLGSIN
jgi:hypothetical protein